MALVKAQKKKVVAAPAPAPEKKETGDGEKKAVEKRGERGARRGGRGDGRPRGDRPPREPRQVVRWRSVGDPLQVF